MEIHVQRLPAYEREGKNQQVNLETHKPSLGPAYSFLILSICEIHLESTACAIIFAPRGEAQDQSPYCRIRNQPIFCCQFQPGEVDFACAG